MVTESELETGLKWKIKMRTGGLSPGWLAGAFLILFKHRYWSIITVSQQGRAWFLALLILSRFISMVVKKPVGLGLPHSATR